MLRTLKYIKTSWKAVLEVDDKVNRNEENPKYLQLPSSSEIVLEPVDSEEDVAEPF